MEKKTQFKQILAQYSKDACINAVYEDALTKYNQNNKYLFSESLQKLIVRIGGMVSSSLVYPISFASNSIGCLDYLCYKILDNQSLYYSFLATAYNEVANASKHRLTLDEHKVQIEASANVFNRMINELCKKLKDDTLQKFKFIRINTTKKKVAPATKHSSSVTNKDFSVDAKIIPWDGVITRQFLFKRVDYLTFGLDLKVNKPANIKRMSLTIVTSNGKEELKVSLGCKRYEIEASKILKRTVCLILNVEYYLSRRETKTISLNLSRVMDK